MKKLVLSLALLAGVTVAAQAQTGVRFGLKAGVVAATAVGKDVPDEVENHFGFQAGGFANIGVSDLISFQPELLYSQKGAQIKASDNGLTFEGKTTFHYIDVPLLLHVNADGLFFEAGPQLGFLAGQKTKQTVSGGGMSRSMESTETDGLRKVDIGYIAGLGYQLESGLSLGVRYNGGITNLDDEGDEKSRNSVFQFQVGLLFGGK